MRPVLFDSEILSLHGPRCINMTLLWLPLPRSHTGSENGCPGSVPGPTYFI
jgi:hypothetical protein